MMDWPPVGETVTVCLGLTSESLGRVVVSGMHIGDGLCLHRDPWRHGWAVTDMVTGYGVARCLPDPSTEPRRRPWSRMSGRRRAARLAAIKLGHSAELLACLRRHVLAIANPGAGRVRP